jgi:hypothetical protein
MKYKFKVGDKVEHVDKKFGTEYYGVIKGYTKLKYEPFINSPAYTITWCYKSNNKKFSTFTHMEQFLISMESKWEDILI